MIERLMVLVVVITAVWLGMVTLRRWQQGKLARLRQEAGPPELVSLGLPPAGPAILYFTTKVCGVCRLQQAPALAQLAQRLENRVSVHTIDAVESPALADYYGVLTVPTTIVFDARWRPAHINHGLVTVPVLLTQIAPLLPERL